MNIEKKFPIYDLSSGQLFAVEPIGTKPKAWNKIRLQLKDEERIILFKVGRKGTGENWAEKVACELANLLDLPHAHYDLGYLDIDRKNPCVITPNFLEEGDELRLGNEFIEGFDKNQRFKHTKHTLDAILKTLEDNNVQLPWKTLEQTLGINTSGDLFIGYLCFDAWIGNTDRHAENWGIITKSNKVNVLAPTFDHASSLGRNESDDKRYKRLRTKDKGYGVNAYVQGAKMPIYDSNGLKLTMKPLIKHCLLLRPEVTHFWIDKIIKIMDNMGCVREIFDLVPDPFISDLARDFAMAILEENSRRLSELSNG